MNAEFLSNLQQKNEILHRGAIYTRSEVVSFILDLVGYTDDRALYQLSLLEPSFGDGDFLQIVVQRLVNSWKKVKNLDDLSFEVLLNSIRAVEIHKKTFESTRFKLIELLKNENFTTNQAIQLVDSWLINEDFLLTPIDQSFDFVVGNPPYVRQELIENELLIKYRSIYKTIYDRADIYVPFIERSLSLLSEKGELGFICADRWMKNKYGAPLRKFISENFHLKIYIDMMDTHAFHSEVTAYPAITIIKKGSGKFTRIAHQPEISEKVLAHLSHLLLSENPLRDCPSVKELAGIINGYEPWLLESKDQTALVRRIENDFPLLEDAGCKVGIGVATGADKIFIGKDDELDIEVDRKIPLATTKDIISGEMCWQKQVVINPFEESGELVDLEKYPKLKKYLEYRKEVISARHCAKKNPLNWYRTIDRITPSLVSKKKLLIPDIKGQAHIVYEDGNFYPHHNLYFVTSQNWNLHALQAVLMSSVTRLFICMYSTKMKGGFLRFQAQYLRRIRLPLWETVCDTLRNELIKAAQNRDLFACNQATFKLYKLSTEEQSLLGGDEN
ncbi:Eco57I restriction-modification methylase domain-containing protein [Acinetobacter seifertii]|uniref:Eco57I restriction-modification methylase domain-containing protein n=1 Tax=Acinetobacter seifertii TaxID=1530123 RepID=UPI00168A67FD|nr:Eco57I restriction-modification methylase domain-containing protein [Acinetobacter seifertii]QNX88373.1 Eco57I restriction-modification methylase domain-containing protein [Acinetobacter seifertii]